MIQQIQKLLEKTIEKLYGVKVEIEVGEAPEETGADYASNVAMKLAKLVHKAPMMIASEIVEAGEFGGYEVSVATPGFLNFISPDEYFVEKVGEIGGKSGKNISPDEYFVKELPYKGKTVVAEFSDPNPFKVLHVGHFYTSVVGESLSRLLEVAGAKVVRANFGGDVGLHVAKTLYALGAFSSAITASDSPVLTRRTTKYDSFRASNLPCTSSTNSAPKDVVSSAITASDSPTSVNELTIEEIGKAYVEGTRAYEEDEEARAQITALNKEIYRINAEDVHEGKVAELYWRGRELSYEYFKEFYRSIGVEFDKFYPESSVAARGLKEVSARVGNVYEKSAGAVVYRGEKFGLHTRVFINREGVPTYEAKDVGLIFTKWDDWHFDESVVVTGNEQTEYMKVVLASVSEYAPELTERTVHLTHGMVRLPGNEKMSSRKGNFLKAVDVLEMVRGELAEANGGKKADEKVAIAAIKYAFLKYKMGGDIIFDPKESVATNGNSGVYLLYSAVRAKKILAEIKEFGELTGFENKFEKKLGKKIAQYSEMLGEAVQEKAPNKICTYLYELAQEFSRFYENVKVVGNEREKELGVLVRAYYRTMEHGLGLLGIEIPEEM